MKKQLLREAALATGTAGLWFMLPGVMLAVAQQGPEAQHRPVQRCANDQLGATALQNVPLSSACRRYKAQFRLVATETDTTPHYDVPAAQDFETYQPAREQQAIEARWKGGLALAAMGAAAVVLRQRRPQASIEAS